MLLVPCPWCGERAEIEFQCAGEASERPRDPMALDDEALADWLYARANRRGEAAERWWHQHGCRQWFTLVRDTSTNAFVDVAPAHRPAR